MKRLCSIFSISGEAEIKDAWRKRLGFETSLGGGYFDAVETAPNLPRRCCDCGWNPL